VIREAGLLACQGGRVTFRYREAATGKMKRRPL